MVVWVEATRDEDEEDEDEEDEEGEEDEELPLASPSSKPLTCLSRAAAACSWKAASREKWDVIRCTSCSNTLRMQIERHHGSCPSYRPRTDWEHQVKHRSSVLGEYLPVFFGFERGGERLVCVFVYGYV